MRFIYQNSWGLYVVLDIYNLMILEVTFVKIFHIAILLIDLWCSGICGFSVCRNFVWPWKFPFGLYIFGKITPFFRFTMPFKFIVTCIRFIYFHVCVSSPLVSGFTFILAPVPVQCWDTVRPKKYCWMSKWIVEWLSGYPKKYSL